MPLYTTDLLLGDLLNHYRERNNYTNPLTDQVLYTNNYNVQQQEYLLWRVNTNFTYWEIYPGRMKILNKNF